MKQDIYSIQEYVVTYDSLTPIEIQVRVYHENKTKLTEEEILKEARGYLKELGLSNLCKQMDYSIQHKIIGGKI